MALQLILTLVVFLCQRQPTGQVLPPFADSLPVPPWVTMIDEQVKRSNVGAVVLSRLMLPKELERWTDEELCKRMLTFELELMKELPIHTLLE